MTASQKGCVLIGGAVYILPPTYIAFTTKQLWNGRDEGLLPPRAQPDFRTRTSEL